MMASLFWFLGEGLRDAIKDNALDGVKQVLNKDKTLVNYVDRQSQSMLHVAVIFNQTETVLELIARGVDIEAKDAQGGRTPLMKASENGHTTCVIALIEAGADCEAKVTSRPVVGATSLWLAADSGHPACVVKLLEAGADLEPNREWSRDESCGG